MLEDMVRGIRIAGIASAVPARVEGHAELAATFGEVAARRLLLGTGVEQRRMDPRFCTSDYCEAAARRLLQDLDWEPSSIQHLIVVTQTPDYRLPATAAILQHRLGLSTSCAAFDINLGCSGFTYGLWVIAKLLSPGQRGLLLVGDTLSTTVSPLDRSLVPLIGDAGSAAAIECQPSGAQSSSLFYACGTDGSGARSIMIEAGGARMPSSPATRERHPGPDQNSRGLGDLYMNGADVFTFALREVPPLVQRVRQMAGWEMEDVDHFVFHQANGFMLVTLANKLEIPQKKLPISLGHYGNSGSPTIPVTLTTQLRDVLQNSDQNLIMTGFGVGLSWASIAIRSGHIVMPPLVELS